MSTVSDPRFARLHTDPRFQRQPQKESKVQVDKRFAGMFTDKRFQTTAPVDRYGRKSVPKKGNKETDELRRLYELAPEDEGGEATAASGTKLKKKALVKIISTKDFMRNLKQE